MSVSVEGPSPTTPLTTVFEQLQHLSAGHIPLERYFASDPDTDAGHYSDQDAITSVLSMNGLTTVIVGRLDRVRSAAIENLSDPIPIDVAVITQDPETHRFRLGVISEVAARLSLGAAIGPEFDLVRKPIHALLRQSTELPYEEGELPADVTLAEAFSSHPAAVDILRKASGVSEDNRFAARGVTEREVRAGIEGTVELCDVLDDLFDNMLDDNIDVLGGNQWRGFALLGLGPSLIELERIHRPEKGHAAIDADLDIARAARPPSLLASDLYPLLEHGYILTITGPDMIVTKYKIDPIVRLTSRERLMAGFAAAAEKTEDVFADIKNRGGMARIMVEGFANALAGENRPVDDEVLREPIELVRNSGRVAAWTKAEQLGSDPAWLSAEARNLLPIIEGHDLDITIKDSITAWAERGSS